MNSILKQNLETYCQQKGIIVIVQVVQDLVVIPPPQLKSMRQSSSPKMGPEMFRFKSSQNSEDD